MLVLENLEQRYGGSLILRGVSLEVPPGKVTALLGRNGVGKTTLLKAVMGLVPAAAGRIRYGDEDLTAAPPHRRARAGIGYVPQGREIFHRLTVAENLAVALHAAPRDRGSVDRALAPFPALRNMLGRRGGDLSGGQQQQLAIARALVGGPSLLILDEPTEGIQPSIIREIERVLRQVATEHRMAVLLVEQYYDFARSLADHYAVMERGEILARGAASGMEADGVRGMLTV